MITMQVLNRISEKILKICLFIGFCLLFIRLAFFHLQVINHHFPLTAPESQPLLNTYLILKGGNPYDLANQPEYTNVYGILYPFIVALIAKLFGINLIVHRGVSSFFIIASCGILFLVTRWMKIPLLLSFIATVIFYSHLILASSFIAKPDSLGLFLFLCSIVIPWRYKYSSLSLIISIGLGILAFMAKPYFVLSIFYLATYIFVFKSKKKGIKYGCLSGFLVLLALFLLNHFFECYFSNIFFIHINILEFTELGFYYAFEQVYTYIKNNLGIIILLFSLIYLFIKKLGKPIYRINLVEFKKHISNFLKNISDLDKPLFEINLDLFTFCLILSLIVFYFKMGKHAGNWLVYIYHLISPFLIIVVFNFARKFTERALSFILLILFLNLFFTYPQEIIKTRGIETYKEWKNLSDLVSQHQNILNSPVIASLLIEQGKKVYDSGESEYFILGAERKIFNISLIDHKIEKRQEQFLQEISESVKQKKYDLIILTKDHLPVGYNRFIYKNLSLINKCYEYQGTLPAPMLTKTTELNIWKPKQISCDSISN
jgi:hypothetical protein